MLLQRKPCLFPVEERTEIICHQNLLWHLEIVALEPRWLFKEATIWKWPSHETVVIGYCSNNMLVFCMKFFCSSFHLESSTVQKHKDCGWRTITGYHRGRHQVYGCNSQAATGGAIKYMVATYKLPQGAPSSMWLRLTGVHMGGTIVVPLEIKPLRGPHGIMVGRHLLLPIVIFFFWGGAASHSPADGASGDYLCGLSQEPTLAVSSHEEMFLNLTKSGKWESKQTVTICNNSTVSCLRLLNRYLVQTKS